MTPRVEFSEKRIQHGASPFPSLDFRAYPRAWLAGSACRVRTDCSRSRQPSADPLELGRTSGSLACRPDPSAREATVSVAHPCVRGRFDRPVRASWLPMRTARSSAVARPHLCVRIRMTAAVSAPPDRNGLPMRTVATGRRQEPSERFARSRTACIRTPDRNVLSGAPSSSEGERTRWTRREPGASGLAGRSFTGRGSRKPRLGQHVRAARSRSDR